MNWMQTRVAPPDDANERKLTATSKSRMKLKESSIKMPQVVVEEDTIINKLTRTPPTRQWRQTLLVNNHQPQAALNKLSQLSPTSHQAIAAADLHSSQLCQRLKWFESTNHSSSTTRAFVSPQSSTTTTRHRVCQKIIDCQANRIECQEIVSQKQAHCSLVRTDDQSNQRHYCKLTTKQKHKHRQKQHKQNENKRVQASTIATTVNLLSMRNILICCLQLIIALSFEANCLQQIELGEGLSLDNSGGQRHQQLGVGGQQQHQQQEGPGGHEWPLQHLDRIKAESKVSAVVGQNVVLNCAVQFKDGQEKPFVVNWLKYPNKLPIYIWYAGYPPHVAQGYESRVSRIGQASLNLSLVKESDQGLYECKIYYLDRKPEDKANGTWIFLDVQAPPHFSQTPPPISYVQAGDSLHLTCQAQSTPAPTLRWYKNKVPIDSDAGAYRLSSTLSTGQEFPPGPPPQRMQPPYNGKQQQHGASSNQLEVSKQLIAGQSTAQLDLFIDNVQAGSTTGDYVCLASNSEGSIEARSQVVLAVPAIITTWPRNQTRLEGERVELQCQAKALPANITYKWLFNDKPLTQLKWFESRYTQRRDGTLVIHSLHRDDQGEYKCQATNGLSHRDRQLASSSSGAAIGDQLAPQPQLPPTTTTTTLATTSLTKRPSSSPSRSRQTVPPAPPIYAEASAHLSVEFPARVTYSPPIQYLPDGLSGQIRCYVASVPPVEFYTWTLNNQQFDLNADANIERLQNGSLIVKQVNKSYEGTYRCTPFNKHGSAGSSAAMEVRVEEPPQFSLRPADFYKANLNGQVKIPCDAKGSPRPTIMWRKAQVMPSPAPSSEGAGVNQLLQLQRSRRLAPAVVRAIGSQGTGRVGGVGGGAASAKGTRRFHQAHLAYDEAADEPDETHHFYAPTSTTSTVSSNSVDGSMLSASDSQQEQQLNGSNPSDNSTTSQQQQQQQEQLQQQQYQEQQTVIAYTKLPSDRSEYKNSHLYLHNLRKEDHGRYECVIENDVATLVASTMLYIEETTPHAPANLRVETKTWSAHVSWTPGYDGGFEQSFVVWYRQVDRPRSQITGSDDQQPGGGHSSSSLASQTDHSLGSQQQPQSNELIDINWHSISVQSSDSTSITVQNLSQDTMYEFYVRAKNIIGEGPRSQVVQAITKRAISGSVTPINSLAAAASTEPYSEDNQRQAHSSGNDPNEGEDADQQPVPSSTATSIRPYLIIHPEYVPAPAAGPASAGSADPASSSASTAAHQSAKSRQHVVSKLDQTLDLLPPTSSNNSSGGGGALTTTSNKVYLIYPPSSKQQPANNKTNNSSEALPSSSSTSVNNTKKQARENEHNNNNSGGNSGNNATTSQANFPGPPVDHSTAPHNVSMMKVAQGWVLSWAPPKRRPSPQPPASESGERAEAIRQAGATNSSSSFSSSLYQQQADEQPEGSMSQLQSLDQSSVSASVRNQVSAASPSSSNSYEPLLTMPLAYSIELKEKNSSHWLYLATSREQSLLLKDLKPGGEYQFRVIAHTPSGVKGTPSQEFRYLIPDMRRKPGLTQAFSATVTSGILFFIACIVIAVCGVNMCNKRRKKRAEKAAYVMMACPVLESHHDIAALNSNSLLKSAPSSNAAQGRVPSMMMTANVERANDDDDDDDDEAGDDHDQVQHRNSASGPPTSTNGHLADNLRRFAPPSATLGKSLAVGRANPAEEMTTTRTGARLKRRFKAAMRGALERMAINQFVTQQLSRSRDNASAAARTAARDTTHLGPNPNGISDEPADGGNYLACESAGGRTEIIATRTSGTKTNNNNDGVGGSGGKHCDLTIGSEREINFSSNEPLPVDVGPIELQQHLYQQHQLRQRRQQQQHRQQSVISPSACLPPKVCLSSPTTPKIVETNDCVGERPGEQGSGGGFPASHSGSNQEASGGGAPCAATTIDDYWIRQPSDRKWGTLTLAASKLAERRAKSRGQQQQHEFAPNNCDGDDDRRHNELAKSMHASEPHQQEPGSEHPQVAPRAMMTQFDVPPPPPPPPGTKPHNYNDDSNRAAAGSGGQNHRRSLSQIVRPTAALSSLSDATVCQLVNKHWPPTSWTQQDLRDWASMRFGPPAQAFVSQPADCGDKHSEQLASISGTIGYWLTAASCMPPATSYQSSYNQVGSTNTWYNCQPVVGSSMFSRQGDTLDSATTAGQALLNHQQQPYFQSPLGKRNSLARSTLPMMAPHANLGPTIVAPPYNLAHDLWPHQQANNNSNNIALCPFYPSPAFAGPSFQQQLANAYNYQQQLVSSESRCFGQTMTINSNDSGTNTNTNGANDDDPITANACLGSHRRKRHLPHIEAQFTITTRGPPELPPRDSLPAAGRQNQQRRFNQTRSRSESESIREGHLFVRDALHQSAASSPQPPGMPQPGQRSEQRRLKHELQLEPAELATNIGSMETIDAREKIETYLRHQQPVAASCSQFKSDSLSSSSASSIELNKVDELTFQPYYNLPSLKYTISLPLRTGNRGELILKSSSQLKPRNKKRDKPAANGLDSSGSATLGKQKRAPEPARERHLNSSTSSNLVRARSHVSDLVSQIEQPAPETRHATEAQQARVMEVAALVERRHQRRKFSSTSTQSVSGELPCSPSELYAPVAITPTPPTPPPVPPHRNGSSGDAGQEPDAQVQQQKLHFSVRAMSSNDTNNSDSFALDHRDQQLQHRLRRRRRRQDQERDQRDGGDLELRCGSTGADGANSTSSPSSSGSSSTSTTTPRRHVDASERGPPSESPPTNDQSVDESYEFDQVSSCSSQQAKSVAKSGRRRRARSCSSSSPSCTPKASDSVRANATRTGGVQSNLNLQQELARVDQTEAEQQKHPRGLSEPIYTQVNKRKGQANEQQQRQRETKCSNGTAKAGERRDDELAEVVVVDRTRYYNGTRQKEQRLTGSASVGTRNSVGVAMSNPGGNAHYYDSVYETMEQRQDNNRQRH